MAFSSPGHSFPEAPVTGPPIGEQTFLANPSAGFEWFYFDIHTPEGIDIVITHHVQPFSLAMDIELLDVFLFENDREVTHQSTVYRRGAVVHGREPFSIRSPDGAIEQVSDGYRLRYCGTSHEYDFRLRQCAESWTPLPCSLLADTRNPDSFMWVVWAPHCTCEGTFRVGDRVIEISGLAYHDQNWGTINLAQHFKSWRWGKYLLDDGIMVYGDLRYRRSPARQLCVSAGRGGACYFDSTPTPMAVESGIAVAGKNPLDSVAAGESRTVQEVHLFINPLPYPNGFLRRVTDGAIIALRRRKRLQPLYRRISNTRYRRYKHAFSFRGTCFPLSFHEEIVFR